MAATTSFTLNGEPRAVHGDPRTSLLSVLREAFALTGTKAVCGEGYCGACMVEVDGAPVPACLRPVGLVEGAEITTIEGVAPGTPAARLQAALLDHDAVQCGMCFPGMMMSLSPLLARNTALTRADVVAAMVGNACRCTGYEQIIEAVLAAQEGTPA